jgi:O-antigen ligase
VAEYVYYSVLFYSILAPGLGLMVPMLAGGMLLALATFCLIWLGTRATAVLATLRLPLACALSFLVVEATVHDGSIIAGFPRVFITWILGLVIVQSLNLRRGFLHRGALVLFAMGLITLPYLIFGALDQRGSVDSMVAGDFNNSNGLGGWFGFCCLYFTITSVETKRYAVRVASSLAAVGCLYVVGLSVSRGALLGTAIGITIALRRLLRRGFVPLLIVIVFSGIIFNLGVFDQIIAQYGVRASEETGRFLVWPLALERFFSSPLLGVGAENLDTYVPSRQTAITPHNSFIWFALSSGVLPLALFVGCWIRAARNAISSGERLTDGPYLLPLLAFTFVMTMSGDLAFMQPWSVMTFCVAMASHRSDGVVLRRLIRPQTRSTFGHAHAQAGFLSAHRRP